MDQFLAALEASGFAALQGSTVTARLVIDQSLINEFIAANVTPRYPALRDLRVAIAADNQVLVRVRSTLPLISDVTLHLEIDRLAILDPALAIRLRIRKQGLSQIVAWALPTIAHKLPPFVKLSGENIVVELATLLDRWRRMLVLLEKLEIQTSREARRNGRNPGLNPGRSPHDSYRATGICESLLADGPDERLLQSVFNPGSVDNQTELFMIQCGSRIRSQRAPIETKAASRWSSTSFTKPIQASAPKCQLAFGSVSTCESRVNASKASE